MWEASPCHFFDTCFSRWGQRAYGVSGFGQVITEPELYREVKIMARLDLPIHLEMDVAVEGGASDALFELGMMYSAGRDVDANLVLAHKWFNLAALKGNKAALEYRKEIATEMSKAQISVAQKLAREYLDH